jgi:hypothetical protein
MSEKQTKIKIKDILKNKVDEMKDNASLFIDIAKELLVDGMKQSIINDVDVPLVELVGVLGPLDLMDFTDSFAITLSALHTVGMDEELFDDLMLKFYFFVKNYFFGEEKEEEVKEEEKKDHIEISCNDIEETAQTVEQREPISDMKENLLKWSKNVNASQKAFKNGVNPEKYIPTESTEEVKEEIVKLNIDVTGTGNLEKVEPVENYIDMKNRLTDKDIIEK